MDGDWDGAPSRRQLLQLGFGAAFGLAAPAIIGAGEASAAALRANRTPRVLTAPNLTWNQPGMRCVYGLRPHRTRGVNLSVDRTLRGPGKFLLHNYGHGGGGITLSLGCALRVGNAVEEIIRDRGANAPLPTVAVIGSGVIGLTVARELKIRWPRLRVRILTKSQNIRDSTSNVAGGQFAPSGVFDEYDRAGTVPFLLGLMQDSKKRLMEIVNRGAGGTYGIRQRFNYSAKDLRDFKAFIPSVYAAPIQGTLPFRNLNTVDGYEYNTWLIEPPIFLEAVRREIVGKGVTIRWGFPVFDRDAIKALPETIVVNCSGLGAGQLMADTSVYPIKGHLVILRNTANLKYFVSGCSVSATPNASYFFGRNNDMVVGGTYNVRDSSTNADTNACRAILARMKAIFDGDASSCMA
jgi:D-amino-acid oxidase